MNPIDELTKRIDDLELALNKTHKLDRLATDKDLHLEQGSRIKGAIYGGHVASDGTGTDLPTGWTSAKSATGTYTVTHNLGDTLYAVITVPLKSGSNRNVFATITAQTTTTFSVNTLLSDTPTDEDDAFFFILIRT